MFMTENEIKEFFRLYFKIDELADKIFDEFEKANLLSPCIHSPRYKGIEFDECDTNLVIRYENSYDNWFNTIEIPFSVIYNNKVLEYIGKLKEEKIERIKSQMKAKEDAELAKEKAEYERLKAKFENE